MKYIIEFYRHDPDMSFQVLVTLNSLVEYWKCVDWLKADPRNKDFCFWLQKESPSEPNFVCLERSTDEEKE